MKNLELKNTVSQMRGPWLAQSVQHVTLDLGVISSNPTLGI